MHKPRRAVDIYQIGTILHVMAQSTTKDYKVIKEQPSERFDVDESSEAIGKAIVSAVRRCRLGVDEPGTKADLLAKELGVKDWKDLVKKSLCCSVTDREDEEEGLVVNVCKKSGSYGFDYTGEKFYVNQDSADEIGALVKKALALYKRK